MVGLKIVQFNGFFARPLRAEHVPNHGQRGIHAVISVDFRLTFAQVAEVGAVKYQNLH